MTSDETIRRAVETTAVGSLDFTDEEWRSYQSIPEQGYSHRHWLNLRNRKVFEDALRIVREEAYQRGHEDGYWNGKTTHMSPAQAAAFMAPYRSRCPKCVESADGKGDEDQ